MNSQDSQFNGVQALRFLAALLVVTTHSFFYASDRLGAQALAWPYGARGVDIFFVISGFVMVISSRNLVGTDLGWARFAIQRLTRIVPLYWLATTIKVVTMLLASSLVLHDRWNTNAIVGSYFFIPYRKDLTHVEPLLGVGWTLVFEMFFYLIFSLALLLKKNIYYFVGIVMALLAALSVLQHGAYPVWMYLFDPIVLEFWFGMLVGYLSLSRRIIDIRLAPPLAAVSLLLVVFAESNSLPTVIIAGIPAAVLVYSVVSMEALLKTRLPAYIPYLGAASYSLYLFHPLFAPAIPAILHRIGLPSFSLSVVVSILACIGLSAFVYSYIELPMTTRLKALPLVSRYTHRSATEMTS